MNKVCGVVVLFIPDYKNVECIWSYLNQVERLIIVDNSPNDNYELFSNLVKAFNIQYIHNKENLGIAKALNIGAARAIEEGYEYMLTMDQDSAVPPDLVEKLLPIIESNPQVAVVSPYHLETKYPFYPKDEKIHETIEIMTSGNIVRLSAMQKIGGFSEALFIDYVDFDFCIRLNEGNFKVLRTNSVIINHNLGNTVRKNVLFWHFYTTNHPPIRLYYRTRNRFYLRNKYKNKYKEFFQKDIINFLKEMIKITFFENKKYEKFKMIILGYIHSKEKRLGVLRSSLADSK